MATSTEAVTYYRKNTEAVKRAHSKYRAGNREKCRAWCREGYVRYREWLDSIREQLLCQQCGASDDLDFHHRDKRTKSFCIGAGQHSRSKTMVEMQKCDVLCGSCHQKLHIVERERTGHGTLR